MPSNVFVIPNWMKNLCVRKPSGTYTPDQVAASLELNLLLNGDSSSLRSSIRTLIPLVPAKRQEVLEEFQKLPDSQIIGAVQEFIDKVNIKLAPLLEEQIPPFVPYIGEDWDRPSERKPNSRESRALRKAKRQSED